MRAQLLDLFDFTPSFTNFIPLSNESVYTALQQQSNQFIHICGGSLSGKTHLLEARVNFALEQNKNALYVDSKLLVNTDDFAEIASTNSCIAIDNIDYLSVAGQDWLFNLFNKIKLGNLDTTLVTSSTMLLEHFSALREDLKTRLLSGLNLTLKALDDEKLLEALMIYVRYEGIKMNNTELAYLINHYTRNTGLLINNIHQIASFALLEKRSITIPLIRQVMGGNN